MALIKTITFPDGQDYSYIRIEGEFLVDIKNKICEVPVRIFKDKNSAKILLLPFREERKICLNKDKFPFTNIPPTTDVRDYLYPLVKAEAFSGALDD